MYVVSSHRHVPHNGLRRGSRTGIPDDRATVVYKRPTDLALLKDVAVCCNLLVCDIMDDGAQACISPQAHSVRCSRTSTSGVLAVIPRFCEAFHLCC